MPAVHSTHPLKHDKNHVKLLEYVTSRLEFGRLMRDHLVSRFEEIDRDMAGFVKLDQDDTQRRRANLRGESPKPTAVKPQFALTQISRGVTFLLSVFSPEGGIFEAIAAGDEQKIANAVTEVMNQHSIHAAYFRQKAIFFLNALKYNLGGLHVEWEEEFGPRAVPQAGGTVTVEPADSNTPLWMGNRIRSVDMYNVLFDPSVHPCDVHRKGEFCAEVKVVTPFQIMRMAEAGEIFNTDQFINTTVRQRPVTGQFVSYYRSTPSIRIGPSSSPVHADGSPNWLTILTAGNSTTEEVGAGIELIDLYIRLLPKEFGLVNARVKGRDHIEIWRITIANGQHIVATEHMTNMHNWLPFLFSVPQEDGLGMESKGIGENLLPLQDFAVHLLNSFVKASRKNLYDLIIYDPSIVDLAAIGEDIAARVPVKTTAAGKDIQKALWSPNMSVDTSKTLGEMEQVIELMEFFFPTRVVQQVAGLERATQFQAAAVVQGSHRDLWRYAKIADDQAMQPMRQIMYSNLIQFQDVLEVMGPDGQRIAVSPAQISNARIEFAIGEGLKSIDRMTVVANVKEVIMAIIQNQAALQEFDVPALLNWWSSLFGVQQDLSAFKRSVTGTPAPGEQSSEEAPPV